MPTSPITQQALSAVAARGQQKGPQSAIAALVAQQQTSEQQLQKLLQTIEKLQQENAVAVQQAAQAGGGAATKIANQVSRRLDVAAAQSQRQQERAEDKEFAIQQQELNAELQKEAAREAAIMGAAIQGSREKYIQSIEQMKAKQADLEASMTAYSARTEEMTRSGKFSSPEGRKMLQRRFDLIKQARIYGDNMFNARHFRAAFQEHNEEMERITGADNPLAILNAQTDPLNLPVPTVTPDDKPLSSLGDLSPQQQFELELTGGYPPKGLVFNREPNFELPVGETPNIIEPATMTDILQDEDVLRTLTDESLRQEYLGKRRKQLIETYDKLVPLKEMMDHLNTVYNQKAQQGVGAALDDFLSDPDPAKFNDVGRYLVSQSLAHTFGGGSQGEELAQIGLEFFDGKREPRSAEDFFTLAAVESASFNISQHLNSEMQGAADPAKGGAMATMMVKQLVDTMGKDATLRTLGVDPSSTAFVDAQAVMQDRLSEAFGFASRLNEGVKNFSLRKQFLKQWGSTIRQMDLHAYMMTAEGEQKNIQLKDLLAELGRTPEQGGLSLEELQAQEPGVRTGFKKLKQSMGLLDALLGIAEELGPDTHAQVSGFITNHLDPVTVPDLKAYTDQIAVEQQRSGYVAAAVKSSRFAYDRHQRGKQRGKERAALESTGETFGKRGAVGVLTEQLPALISLGHQGLRSRLATDATRAVTGVLGEKAGLSAARGSLALFKGQQPLPLPGETAQMQNLTLAEKQQIIRESNKRD